MYRTTITRLTGRATHRWWVSSRLIRMYPLYRESVERGRMTSSRAMSMWIHRRARMQRNTLTLCIPTQSCFQHATKQILLKHYCLHSLKELPKKIILIPDLGTRTPRSQTKMREAHRESKPPLKTMTSTWTTEQALLCSPKSSSETLAKL